MIPNARFPLRSAVVRVSEVSPGVLRVESGRWSAVARSAPELARLTALALKAGGVLPEVPVPSRARPVSRPRSDQHRPEAWTDLGDGRWRSPGNRVYDEDTQVVRRVKGKLGFVS